MRAAVNCFKTNCKQPKAVLTRRNETGVNCLISLRPRFARELCAVRLTNAQAAIRWSAAATPIRCRWWASQNTALDCSNF